MKSFKKRLLLNRWAMNFLSKMSVLFSPWMRPGVCFYHQGRCGSTVVANLLGQHPKIFDCGEIFLPYVRKKYLPTKPENILRVWQTLAFPKFPLAAVKFFECMDLSVLGLNITEFVDVVRHCGYRKFIILNRKNYLRKIVSREMAIQRKGKWHFKVNEEPPLVTIRLDVENLRIGAKTAPKTAHIVDIFKYMDEQYQCLRMALAGEDVLELTYEEDIFNDPVSAYTKVCNWLNVESLVSQIGFRRSNVMKLDEVVENWSEVLEALRGTQYAWMTKLDSR